MTNETKKEVDIAEFKSLVESYHKILGLDIGSKRIGVAISTSDMTGALPLRTIKYSNMKDFLKELNELVKLHDVKALIIGLPLNMDGSKSEMSQNAHKFSRRMSSRYNIQSEMFDERLTSFEARVHEEKTHIDAIAARLILESWLRE